MSYILEALKKFEKKREQQDLVESLNLLGALEPEPQKRPWWPYALVAALLLNAGIMLWWLAQWRSEKKETPANPSTVLSPKMVRPKGDQKAKKDLPGLFKNTYHKPQNAEERTVKSPASNNTLPAAVPNQLKAAQPKSISQKREALGGKRMIYFKDGTSQSCEDIQVTENFVHCLNHGGGSIINRNKIDLEKTLSGNTP